MQTQILSQPSWNEIDEILVSVSMAASKGKHGSQVVFQFALVVIAFLARGNLWKVPPSPEHKEFACENVIGSCGWPVAAVDTKLASKSLGAHSGGMR